MATLSASTLDVSSIKSTLQVASPNIKISTSKLTLTNGGQIETYSLAAIQAELESEKRKNAELNTQITSLKATIEALKVRLSEQDQNTEFTAIISQGSQAILDASTAEDIANQAKDAAASWAGSAQDAADLALSTDPTSAATVDAQAQAQIAQVKKSTVFQAAVDVSGVVSSINELAGSFIKTPAEVTPEQDTELKALIIKLQDHISAASIALNALKEAAEAAAQFATVAAVEYDNWDMLGALFGFTTTTTSSTEKIVEAESSGRSAAEPVLEEIDNWDVVQHKFSLPELVNNASTST